MTTNIHFLSCSVLLTVRNAMEIVAEKSNTHILCSITYYTKNCAIYEIMWKNIVEPNRRLMTIGCMIVAC
jgi:hypothetical protein